MEYHGRCHCGRVRFSFRGPEIKEARRCNCSLCVRRGAIMSPTYFAAADFTPHADPSDLGLYRWNDHVLNNYFCRTCGVFAYIEDLDAQPHRYRVNLGCVEGLDALALDISIIDGKGLPLAEGVTAPP